mmetsp:Transcript_58841/g.116563  ORF Transcript_58841/g.116563 Transcript_58841/m.116563 type:complete len:345 (+) Transcript_58841:270-1304(+)
MNTECTSSIFDKPGDTMTCSTETQRSSSSQRRLSQFDSPSLESSSRVEVAASCSEFWFTETRRLLTVRSRLSTVSTMAWICSVISRPSLVWSSKHFLAMVWRCILMSVLSLAKSLPMPPICSSNSLELLAMALHCALQSLWYPAILSFVASKASFTDFASSLADNTGLRGTGGSLNSEQPMLTLDFILCTTIFAAQPSLALSPGSSSQMLKHSGSIVSFLSTSAKEKTAACKSIFLIGGMAPSARARRLSSTARSSALAALTAGELLLRPDTTATLWMAFALAGGVKRPTSSRRSTNSAQMSSMLSAKTVPNPGMDSRDCLTPVAVPLDPQAALVLLLRAKHTA